jgi:hypothetical protein
MAILNAILKTHILNKIEKKNHLFLCCLKIKHKSRNNNNNNKTTILSLKNIIALKQKNKIFHIF